MSQSRCSNHWIVMNVISAFSKAIQSKANIGLLLIITIIMVGLGYMITSSVSPSVGLMKLAHGRNVLDAQFWRTPDTLYTQLADYGELGRRLYLTRISPLTYSSRWVRHCSSRLRSHRFFGTHSTQVAAGSY